MDEKFEEFEEFKSEILRVANTTSDIIERYSILLYGNWVKKRPQGNFDSADSADEHYLAMMQEATRMTVNKAVELLLNSIHYTAGLTTDPGDQPTNQLIIDQTMVDDQLTCPVPSTSAAKPSFTSAATEEIPKKKTRRSHRIRQPGPRCSTKCGRKCYLIQDSLREKICREFWQMHPHERQEGYKNFGLIITHQKKVKVKKNNMYVFYNEKKETVVVCKHFFMTTFGRNPTSHHTFLTATDCNECTLGTCDV